MSLSVRPVDCITCLSVPVRGVAGAYFVATVPGEPKEVWKRLMDDDPVWNSPMVTQHWTMKVDGPIRPSRRTRLSNLIKYRYCEP
jgi:hypothetical protein